MVGIVIVFRSLSAPPKTRGRLMCIMSAGLAHAISPGLTSVGAWCPQRSGRKSDVRCQISLSVRARACMCVCVCVCVCVCARARARVTWLLFDGQ